MEELTLDALIEKIKSDDPNVRTAAWLAAGNVGACAVKPLAKVMTEGELEVSRAAKRGIWKIVRTVGAPGVTGAKKPVLMELIDLLGDDQPVAVRREVMWMISELCGGGPAVAPIAALLSNEQLREDARMVLQRIPGEKPLQALKDALQTVSDDFKINIAQSLRARGVEVAGFPCQKLVPTKQTGVEPVGK